MSVCRQMRSYTDRFVMQREITNAMSLSSPEGCGDELAGNRREDSTMGSDARDDRWHGGR